MLKNKAFQVILLGLATLIIPLFGILILIYGIYYTIKNKASLSKSSLTIIAIFYSIFSLCQISYIFAILVFYSIPTA
ncbi:hypothetical protein JI667_19050 [Bacillus sp. NTK074B]|uniref:hypothetical protein n=1 Tax=Bacillus sp. NTK074B TaxID=2802174 RepID=UPI001A8E9DB5|nr:hypothetical protein [Bacillus sp. NTK074B]